MRLVEITTIVGNGSEGDILAIKQRKTLLKAVDLCKYFGGYANVLQK